MNSNYPLVSIVLPTYNGSAYLSKSIDSCLKQTYSNIELIVVDDASSDKTPDIIKSYKDHRIVSLRNPVNLRLPNSLNAGFGVAHGQFLTWTSDDNFYHNQAIEKMLDFLNLSGKNFVYCDYFTFKDNSIEDARRIFIPENPSFKKINFVRACFMYTRKVKDAVGNYDAETELSEDYDYWLRVSKKFHFAHLKEPLYYYRTHEQALYSRRFWEQELVKCLVRLKHGIFTREEARNFFVSLYCRREKKVIPRILNLIEGHGYLGNILNSLLSGFQNGLISFCECKTAIQKQIFK